MNSSLPLSGRGILITREEQSAKGMAEMIRQHGGIPHVVPLIAFRPFKDRNEHTYLDRLTSYEWIFFTSKNGVNFFFEKLKESNISLVGKVKVAAVGKKTCKALKRHGVFADFVPEEFTGSGLAEEFVRKFNSAGPVLISKGNLARDTVSAFLAEKDISCDEWITYETCFPEGKTDKLISLLKKKELSVLTFTSPSTIKRFMTIVRDNHLTAELSGLIVACIGPVTKEAAESYGLIVQVVPDRYTVEDMIEDLRQYFFVTE